MKERNSPIPHPCRHEWQNPAEVTREAVVFGAHAQTSAKLVVYGERTCRKCHVTEEFKLSVTIWSVE